MGVYPLTKDLLDSLVREKNSETKQIKIEKDSVLEKMVYGFEKCKKLSLPNYKNCLNLIPKKYTAYDVEKFSLIIPKIIKYNSYLIIGIYLETLINNCEEDGIVIYAPPWKINQFGLDLKKKVIVNGDMGDYLGNGMQDGIIILNGNASDCAGAMKNGSMIINGNVGRYLGTSMDKGTIIVNGNAGDDIGFALKDGEIIINGDAGREIGQSFGGIIHLNGNYGSINKYYTSSGIYGGTIYHKGKLIVKDGKMLI